MSFYSLASSSGNATPSTAIPTGIKHRLGPAILIGLIGLPGSGAEACARILAEAYQFAMVSIADSVHLEASNAFDVDPRLFAQAEVSNVPCAALQASRCADPKFRALLQMHGHDGDQPLSPATILKHWEYGYRRLQSGSEYWSAVALRSAFRTRNELGYRRLVICGIKHMSDANAVQAVGGVLWRAQRASRPICPDSELAAIAVTRSINTDLTPACLIYETLAAYREAVDALLPIAGANHA